MPTSQDSYLFHFELFFQLHEFDDQRFDIRAHDCTYFFRADTPQGKEEWMEVIEANKVRRNHSSALSEDEVISSCFY